MFFIFLVVINPDTTRQVNKLAVTIVHSFAERVAREYTPVYAQVSALIFACSFI